jgi:hypothetical protein
MMLWRQGPRVFVNSIPKAGTHLLTSILEEVPGVMLSRVHIDINDIASSGWTKHAPMSEFRPDLKKLERCLRKIQGGQVVTAHLPWDQGIIDTLETYGFRTIFLSRGQADILNSRYHYITGLRRHHLHERLMTEYTNEEQRRKALVDGIPWGNGKVGTEPAEAYFSAYEPWASQNGILHLRFEDLVGVHGGGSDEIRKAALTDILKELDCPFDTVSVETLHKKSLGKKSFTLRSGRINESVS